MLFDQYLLEKIRAKFPRAAKDLKGRDRIFFDNGTGTLVVRDAAEAEAEARVNCSANVGGGFDESKQAGAVILAGRNAVADLLNAPSPNTIVTGESATMLLFHLSYAMGRECTGKENVVTTDYEHYSNITPWVELEKRRRIKEVRFARLKEADGTLDLEHLKSLVDTNTRVVAVTAASNLLGTKSPLIEVCNLAHEVDAYVVVDAVHHVSHGTLDVTAMNCDFLVFSGYKLFSSHGSFLYGKEIYLEKLEPYKVEPAPNNIPSKWEGGTRDQSMFAAISGVVDHFVWLADQLQNQPECFLEYSGRKRSLKLALHAIENYELDLTKAVLFGFKNFTGLMDMPTIKIYGLTDLTRLTERDPTIAFKVMNVPDDEVVRQLWNKGGIATRALNFYSKAVETYNQQTMVRISLAHYNTLEEIGVFLQTLNQICKHQ